MSSDFGYDSADAQTATPFGSEFQNVLAARHKEPDQFYESVIPRSLNADQANVMRQALARNGSGANSFYHYDVDMCALEARRPADAFQDEPTLITMPLVTS